MTRDELAGHFKYLSKLRASGRTNMWAAPAFLKAERGLSADDANKVFGQWQDVFDGDESTPEELADKVLEVS